MKLIRQINLHNPTLGAFKLALLQKLEVLIYPPYYPPQKVMKESLHLNINENNDTSLKHLRTRK